jgi:hypothetical protein
MTTEFDPTTNRVPFELLTDEEKKILMNWPHGVEFFNRDGVWSDVIPSWLRRDVYRGKPAPVVTSEWVNIYPDGPAASRHRSRGQADSYLVNPSGRIAVLRIDTCEGVSTAHIEKV